jgi:hypothetical protein
MFALLKMLFDAVQAARRAAISSQSQSPLNQLLLALHNYHDAHAQFPPAYFADENGKPMHSWRVMLLPYVEEGALYKAYNFSEPWNGPNNSKLANKIPSVYRSPSESESNTFANIVALVGPGTAFPGSSSTKLSEFADGQENTILLTEITRSDIPWLEPRDLRVEEMSFRVNDKTKPSISAVYWRRPYVVFADSIHAYGVSNDISPDALKAIMTIAGHEPVTRSGLQAQGYLK